MTVSPPLLIDRLPLELHRRLDNWGNCMRDRRRPEISPTYRICEGLAKRAGQTRNLENDQVDDRDWNDAQRVEKAWCAAQYRVDGKLLMLLRGHYVTGSHWRASCRLLKIQARSYDDEVVRAVVAFGAFLALYERPGHNPDHNLTTV